MPNNEQHERAARIVAFSLSDAHFDLNLGGAKSQYKLSNLSETGIAFLRIANDVWPADGSTINGDLHLPGTDTRVTLKLIRATEKVAACLYIEPVLELKRRIRIHFIPELKAHTLTNINPARLQGQPDGDPHWHFDGGKCELYYVAKDDKLVRFRLGYENKILEKQENQKPVYFHSDHEIISNIPEAERAELMRFLHNIEEVPEDFIKGMRDCLNS